MKYRRDDEALKAAIETYSIEGAEVYVPFFQNGIIQEQRGTGMVRRAGSEEGIAPPMTFFLVRAKSPVPWADWVARRFGREAGQRQMGMEEWKRYRGTGRYGEHVGINLHDYLSKKLEEGGTLSLADVEYDDLLNRGCIDPDGNVSCYTFWQKDIQLLKDQLKVGQLVEHEYKIGGDTRNIQGAIAGFSKDRSVVYLEVFTPIPYLECPDAISSTAIQKSFYSPYTYVLGYGVYEALELASEETGENLIPPGKWDTEDVKERFIYTMKDTYLPIKVVSDICKEAYGGDEPCFEHGGESAGCSNAKHCLWQSLILYVVPLYLDYKEQIGTWKPLAEKSVPTDVVISYEDEDEG